MKNGIMKYVKRMSLIMSMMLLVSGTMAQEIDEDRMARDLKIAEDILGTLSNQDARGWFSDNIESNYVPGYGVIFTVPMKSFFIKQTSKGRVAYSTSGSTVVINTRVSEDEEDAVKVATVEEITDEDEYDGDEIFETMETETKEQISTFLADYADLIGQLKPSDRVVVQTRNRQDVLFYNTRSSDKTFGALSAQVLKSDISAYKQGKISRESFDGKIEFTEGGEKVEKDIELFATIFSRLYEPDLSTTYYLSSRRIGYTSLKNLGITFNLKFYSSSSDDGLHTIRTTGESGLTQEERDSKINAMYPQFEASFKENILDYGRTIKSLDADDMLIFKARLTECRGCEMPGEIEVSVKMMTLMEYDKGSLSREKALGQITVKRI